MLFHRVIELRKKTSQSRMVEPRRVSTSSLPRGMSSLSSLGSHRLSFHDDQSAFMHSPRSSTSSMTGMDLATIPAKPAPPPGSKPKSQQLNTSITSDVTDVGKVTGHAIVKEPSPADDAFKNITEDNK